MRALVGLAALLLAHGAAVAEPCPMMGLESRVLSSGAVVGTEGGLIVGEVPAPESDTKPNPSRAAWKIRTKAKQTAAKETVIAPGLVVYHPPARAAEYELLGTGGKRVGTATISAKLPDLLDAPQVRMVRNGIVGPRHPSLIVEVQLDGQAPNGVVALVLQKAKGRTMSWGRAFGGMTSVRVYSTDGGCVTVFPEGTEMAGPGERVVAFWIDATGRRSRVSTAVIVEKIP